MISISYYHPVTYKCLIVYKLLDDSYSSISLMKSLGFIVLDINLDLELTGDCEDCWCCDDCAHGCAMNV